MKAVMVEEIGSFVLKDADIPCPGAGEALVRVTVAGLCRTDLKVIKAGHRDLVLPRIPGEEVVGTIEEMGSGADGFSQGERVYIYPGKSCGLCKPCETGAGNLCEHMEIMGFHRDGGFAGYVVAPAKSLILLPEGITDEEAVFAEPLSCCLNALELACLKEGETIGIWGAGPAGVLLKRAADAMNAIPFVIEPDEKRRSFVQGFPAPPGMMFDVCIAAAGSADAYNQALMRLAPRGRLVVFSGLAPDCAGIKTDFNRLHYFEQTVVGAYGCSFRHGQKALELLTRGDIHVKDLVSHRLPLGELGRALELVERRECMKVHLYP